MKRTEAPVQVPVSEVQSHWLAGSEQSMADALKRFGWTCGPQFWERYYTDAWVFSLANAVERLTAELKGGRPRAAETRKRPLPPK